MSVFANDLAEFVYYRTYSRFLPREGRRENWDESVSRLMAYYAEVAGLRLSRQDYDFIHEHVRTFQAMPSMRLLWTAGDAARSNSFGTYNCSYIVMTSINSFAELLYVLMHGTGVGYSVESRFVQQIPAIKEKSGKTATVLFEDSKEGWMLGLLECLKLWWGGSDVEWDLRKIRPKGASLKTFGGRSSGPEPLDECLAFIQNMVDRHRGRQLSPFNVHEICCKIAEVIVVGGVRRSSLISLSDLYDMGMRSAKTGQFWIKKPHLSMSNNSAVYSHKPTSVEFMREWLSLAESGSGERGIFARGNLSASLPERRAFDPDMGVNPCSEIILRPYQTCNLTEVVLRKGDSMGDVLEKIRAATIMGTIQSMLTSFGDVVSQQWRRNAEEERLLGVSLTGQMDAYDLLTPENLQAARDYAIGVNVEYSRKLGINRAAAVTCSKPSGTVSQLVNSSSGFHPRYAPYYIRRIRISSNDPLYQMMRSQGVPFHPEVGQIDGEASTYVCEFPVQAPEGAITRNDMTALEQLNQWLKVKENWAEHTVSATIYVGDDEWFNVGNWVYEHFDSVTGISFLPRDGHVYSLAPYEEISADKFKAMKKQQVRLDYSKLPLFEKEDHTTGSQALACTGDKCEVG